MGTNPWLSVGCLSGKNIWPGFLTDAQSRLREVALRRREALALLKDAWDYDLVSQAYVTRYVLHSVAIVDGTEPPDAPYADGDIDPNGAW